MDKTAANLGISLVLGRKMLPLPKMLAHNCGNRYKGTPKNKISKTFVRSNCSTE